MHEPICTVGVFHFKPAVAYGGQLIRGAYFTVNWFRQPVLGGQSISATTDGEAVTVGKVDDPSTASADPDRQITVKTAETHHGSAKSAMGYIAAEECLGFLSKAY